MIIYFVYLDTYWQGMAQPLHILNVDKKIINVNRMLRCLDRPIGKARVVLKFEGLKIDSRRLIFDVLDLAVVYR